MKNSMIGGKGLYNVWSSSSPKCELTEGLGIAVSTEINRSLENGFNATGGGVAYLLCKQRKRQTMERTKVVNETRILTSGKGRLKTSQVKYFNGQAHPPTDGVHPLKNHISTRTGVSLPEVANLAHLRGLATKRQNLLFATKVVFPKV